MTGVPRRCQVWILSPLSCGHEDTDPTVWHTTPTGETVCADCCPTCTETAP